MKLKTHYFALLISVTILLLSSCENTNSENSSNDDVITNLSATQVEGFLPPVMNFYEVDLQEDGQTVLSSSGTAFNIIKDKEVYWAQWKYEEGEQLEKIQMLVEKTPGLAYEFQTQSASGLTTYIISKVDDEGVWSMANSNNGHFGYLCDAAVILKKNSNL